MGDAGQRLAPAARPRRFVGQLGSIGPAGIAALFLLASVSARAQKTSSAPAKSAPLAPAAEAALPSPAPAPAPVASPPPATSPAADVQLVGSAADVPLVGFAPTPAPPAARVVVPVPTADETPAPSDHDAVVGHFGIEIRRIDTSPFPLDLRADAACPRAQTTACTVSLGALSLRYWQTRNLAFTGGLAFGLGGGRDAGHTLDTYVGLGPIAGVSILLGNWRHFAVAASPEASLVWFSPGHTGATSTTLVTVRAALEGELHFGFVGVPALSLGLDAGLGFRWVSAAEARVWSVGVVGPGGVASVLSDLFVRYYL